MIAIIAVLAVVLVLTLNPADLLKQARDSNRLSDLDTMNRALSIYSLDTGASMGNASTVYISIPDGAATSTAGTNCASLGLPTLPTGWTYHCASFSTYRNTDGTGWIPVNFKSVSSGSPIGTLPLDPVNTSSSRLYYTYTTNGSQYETTAAMESQKYKLGGTNDVISNDGGTLASVYEKGSKLGLEPLDYGDSSLVGLWTFDEGTGTVTYDYSGNNATGSWNGTLGSQWTSGKVGVYAGNFDGSTNYVQITSATPAETGDVTFSFWLNLVTVSNNVDPTIYNRGGESGTTGFNWIYFDRASNTLNYQYANGSVYVTKTLTSSAQIPFSSWTQVTIVHQRSNKTITSYLNGAIATRATYSDTALIVNSGSAYIGVYQGVTFPIQGAVDDFRVYNRALSAAEIQAIYNATK